MKETNKIAKGAFKRNQNIVLKASESEEELSINVEDLPIKGKHNEQNTMSAGIISQLKKVRNETIRQSLMNFIGVPHRLEFVVFKEGVQYINDSKATNTNATYFAFDAIRKPIVWIAGGIDDSNDYGELVPAVKEKVKALICIGLDNTKIIQAFEGMIDIYEAKNMAEAVQISKQLAERGDTVLLSPASKSYDLFKNYEDRGDQFKEQITKI